MFDGSHSEFTRTAAERTTRPSEVQRLGFGDLLQSRLKTRRRHPDDGFRIVPIESVRPGDTQVIAAAEPRSLPPAPRITLDDLSSIPSVESIVASTELTLNTTLPLVTELILVHPAPVPEPGFFALLPNLRSLHASMVSHHGRRLSIDELRDLDIRDLAVRWDRLEPGEIDELGGLSGLRRLLLHAGPYDSVKSVGALRNLEYLLVEGGRSGWARLAPLDRLEEAVLWDARLPNLRPLGGWSRLRSLSLRGRRVKSLEGIGALRALETAALEVLGIDDLGPLAGLRSLRDLSLSGGESPWHVRSLAPLAGLTQLKELEVRAVRIPGNGLAAFRKARPDVVVDVPDTGASAGISVGSVEIHPPEPAMGLEKWWILQDLTELLGTHTNADAEARLRHAIGRHSRDLLKRLSFDTEAGGVGVQAKSEADIREVAQLLGELAAARERRS